MNHRIRVAWQRVIAALMLVVWCSTTACSVPTGDKWDDFLQAIRDMDPGSMSAAKREEARWRALESLREHEGNPKVGDVECTRSNSTNKVTEPVRIRQIIDCLANTQTLVFSECIQARMDDIRTGFEAAIKRSASPDDTADCKFVPNPLFIPDEKWDPDQLTEEDLARTAMQSSSPPAWMIAAGVVVVVGGGVFVFGSGWAGLLCGADIHYACDQAGQGDR